MIVQKQHKFDMKSVLTSRELSNLGDQEKCAICGKLILFGITMSRSNYQFKRQVAGKMRYYCKESCMRVDDKLTPRDKRRKQKKIRL